MVYEQISGGWVRILRGSAPQRSVQQLFLLFATILIPLATFTLIASPRKHNVAIVVVSDRQFSEKYQTQAQSVECYAKRFGYSFIHLDPSEETPECSKHHNEFFFRKHCAVSKWLQSMPASTTAVVLDGDTIGGTSDISLQKWLAYDFDISFYERSWNFEIMAGNYIVRNTAFSRRFLHKWAMFEYATPPGFSSADNGAIHQVILDALSIRNRHLCHDMYRALNESVMNLGPYYEFVACTRRLLGPPRTHVAYASDNSARKLGEEARRTVGKITIFPRQFGFAVDSLVHGYAPVRNFHPFHHGVKSENWTEMYKQKGEGLKFIPCEAFKDIGEVTDKELGAMIKISDENHVYKPFKEASVIPRWIHVDEGCYSRLWCGPLRGVSEWPPGFVSEGGNVRNFSFENPGVDWYNEFAEGLRRR